MFAARSSFNSCPLQSDIQVAFVSMFFLGQSNLSSQTGEDFSDLPVGVALHGLSKIYGDRVAIENLNVSFYEGHVTSLLGHNGAGKTTTMYVCLFFFSVFTVSACLKVNTNAFRPFINCIWCLLNLICASL